jgi:hypothetical protein
MNTIIVFKHSINIGLRQNYFSTIHFTETTVMYRYRFDKGRQDSAQFYLFFGSTEKINILSCAGI